jgi:hypothetical protein
VTDAEKLNTSISKSAMRQIHVAIELLHKSQFDSAVTLAAAADGMLPKTTKPTLFSKLKALADSLPTDEPGAKGANDFSVWLKHGAADKKGNETGPETAVISKLEAVVMITRAVSHYNAVYGGLTPQMGAFRDYAIEWVQANKSA